MYHGKRIGVVIPAHNEAPAIGAVVSELLALTDSPVDRVVVCDNASSDGTAEIAQHAGADVVHEARKGYGYACEAGIRTLGDSVDCLVFMDGDRANSAAELTKLLDAWLAGADLVIGSRQLGHTTPGALAPLQTHGNRLAGVWLTALYGTRVTDLGPFRAISPQRLQRLNLHAPTFRWTIDMQIAALQRGYRVREVPVDTAVRIGRSKVSGTVRGTWGASKAILSAMTFASVQKLRERARGEARRLKYLATKTK